MRSADQDVRPFEQFFDLSHDLFCIAGFDGHFKRLNTSWEQILGIPRSELLGRPFLELVHPDDRARTLMETVLLTRGEDTIAFENRYRCADGSYRRLRWAARVALQDQLIFASARDVTEEAFARERQRELMAELHEQTCRLEFANRELEAFSYSVSHDLRAPLRAINGFAEIIQENSAQTLNTESKQALGRIRSAAERLAVLIDDLLELSRVARAELSRSPVDVSAMAASVVVELRRRMPDRHVDVTIAPGMRTSADPRLLRIVLQNLMENAWKYTAHTSAPRVDVFAEPHGDTTAFVVRDNGAGFDMRHADKLFGTFERLHTDQEFPGSGIGLATVQRITQRHGGHVQGEGLVGAGATFRFTLESAKRE